MATTNSNNYLPLASALKLLKNNEIQPCILINFNNVLRGSFTIELMLAQKDTKTIQFQRVSFTTTESANIFGKNNILSNYLNGISDAAITAKLINKGVDYIKNKSNPLDDLKDPEIEKVKNIYLEAFKYILLFSKDFISLFYLDAGLAFTNNNIKPIKPNPFDAQLYLVAQKFNKVYGFKGFIKLNETLFSLTDFEPFAFFLKSNNEFYILDEDTMQCISLFKNGILETKCKTLADFKLKYLNAYYEKYTVDVSEVYPLEIIDEAPTPALILSELSGKFLMITPKFYYQNYVIGLDDKAEPEFIEENSIVKINRHLEKEQTFKNTIQNLHQNFERQNNGFFYITFADALRNRWFLTFYEAIVAMEVLIEGFENLKHFKINTNKPKVVITTFNKLDWFDLSIEITYGSIPLPLSELKKALKLNQGMVLLKNGTLGIIPAEWHEKFGMALSICDLEGNTLTVNKINAAVFKELNFDINDVELKAEIENKKLNLLLLDEKMNFEVPTEINAKLRDYQLAGFNWLCTLHKIGWGGCLADDMGLGKTLQCIAFLQYAVLNKKYDAINLVIVPTSLMYNWQNELDKFAPSLKYKMVYGPKRDWVQVFEGTDIVITSYGIIRSDYEQIMDYKFASIIVDESHTIKNPQSQNYKAILQLQAYNNFVLSGTPIQNSTIDLYAQMNFANRGMLGQLAFFKDHFAKPIDKLGDAEKGKSLQKLIAPFMMRRTKENVAKDLPAKMEAIHYCSMGEEQQKIYDSFKEDYRNYLLGKIADVGITKVNFFVLEAITKLRQICNSPALIKNDEVTYPNTSVKIEELVNELVNNLSNHKVLIFSQFTGMLALIGEALDAESLPYLYLDGKTKAQDRQSIVDDFQNNEDNKIFLISLKAGGVGLNLTAADYVYIIDPWWNSAAEAQAIDRTHRIGQTKTVFAYKMICKDTIEEKIVLLQERKKNLSTALITEDEHFVKSFTKEDVLFLFE